MHVKLLKTFPAMHYVQLSTVGPKQKEHLLLQDSHVLVSLSAYIPGLHTYLQELPSKYNPEAQEWQSAEVIPLQV